MSKPFYFGIDIYDFGRKFGLGCWYVDGDKQYALTNPDVVELKEFDTTPSLLEGNVKTNMETFNNSSNLQRLMDELWRNGIRPETKDKLYTAQEVLEIIEKVSGGK